MVTPMRFALLASLALVVVSTGCIVHESPPPPSPFGDLAFDWSFGGESDCANANVDFVDVVITDDFGEVVIQDEESCVGGGLTFTDLRAGVYGVDVSAVDHNGVIIYHGAFTIHVFGGQENYAGVIELDPTNSSTGEGTLGFFWSFLYPTDNDDVTDCALAGVDLVDVFVTPDGANGEEFDQTSICDPQHQGLDINNLNEGRYTLRLQAYGSYNGADVLLYDSGDIVVDVLADQTTDVGDIAMPRVADNFSDFDVAWTFADQTCASAGVDTVSLSFQRDGFTSPEDSLDVDCGAANVVRRTFVPGTYTVRARAVGTDYAASVPVDLPPNSVGQVDLVLTQGG